MTVDDTNRYLRQIQLNVETLKALSAGASDAGHDASDWIVTIHFYILCLYAKALGRCEGKNFQEHYSIRQWLNSNEDLVPITKSYRQVEEWSRDARYEGRHFTRDELHRFRGCFNEVRDHLMKLLKTKGLHPPKASVVDP